MSSILDYFPKNQFFPQQKEALLEIEQAIKNGYKNILLKAPTGLGKSIVGMTTAFYMGEAHLTTSQKSLQRQIVNDFDNVTMVKGRKNFLCKNCNKSTDRGRCIEDSKFMCNFKPTAIDDGYSFAFESYTRGSLFWKNDIHCDYWEQKAKAINAPFTVNNYDFIVNEYNYVGDIGPRKLLVSDECQNIEKKLMDFMEFSFSRHDLEEMGVKVFNDLGNNLEKWVIWLAGIEENTIPEAETKKTTEIEYKQEEQKNTSNIQTQQTLNQDLLQLEKELKKINTYKTKLKNFKTSYYKRPHNWVFYRHYDSMDNVKKVEFKPVMIDDVAEEKYLSLGEYNLFMSATVEPKSFVKSLGIQGKCALIDVPPLFPIENQPIYNLNVGKFNRESLSEYNEFNILNRVVDSVDLILTCFPKQKGIIHTTNHFLANYIANNSVFGSRILTHHEKDRDKILNYHMETEEPTVLCSPSMSEGADLKGDLSRFQILTKTPYPYTGPDNKQLHRRIEWDEDYQYVLLVQRLVQSKGRSIRSMDDYAVTFTLDSNFSTIQHQFAKNTKERKKENLPKKEYIKFYDENFNRYVRNYNDFLNEYGYKFYEITKNWDDETLPTWLRNLHKNIEERKEVA